MGIADVGTGVLVLCAVVVTGLLVRREFGRTPPSAETTPRILKDWKQYATGGQRDGTPAAPITIVEFSDYQCPFCRQASLVISRVMAEHPGQIAHVFRHYPLEAIHPHAMLAAVASHCAESQHAFTALHDALFALQDSIGKRRWTQFAVDAGVGDTLRFARCMMDSAAVMPRIRADVEAGKAIGLRGTPAILVNEHYIAGAPTDAELQAVVAKILMR